MNAQTDIAVYQKTLEAWEAAKTELEIVKVKEMELRKQCAALAFPDAKEGVNRTSLLNGYELKMTRKITYTLGSYSECLAASYAVRECGNEGAFLADKLFKFSADLSSGEYKKLDHANNPTHAAIKKIVDSVLTTKDGAPTLEIIAPKK